MNLLLFLAAISLPNGIEECNLITADLTMMSSEMPVITPTSILIHQRYSIVELSMDGAELHRIDFQLDEDDDPKKNPPPWEVANFNYIQDRDLIAVVLGRKWPESGQPVEHRIRFYDRGTDFYMKGYDLSREETGNSPLNVYFRQIIPISNGAQLFVNRFGYDNLGENKPLLEEIRLIPFQDGYAIESVGAPFNVQHREIEPLAANYKRRWIVANESLIVASEMQPVLKRYNRYQVRGKRDQYEESVVRIQLAGWVQPYQAFEKGVAMNRWALSFSRFVGLQEFQDGLLSAYTTPRNLSTGDRPEEGAPLFDLNLQRMDYNGRNVGEPIQIPNAYLAGVQDQNIWVITKEIKKGETQYSLCRISS
jgi:hypothetical protein